MTRDKKILYALASAITVGLLLIVLLARTATLAVAAVGLTVAAVATPWLIKKRKAPSLVRHTVLLLTVTFVLLYFTVFYLSGLSLGFVKTTVPFNLKNLFGRFLPAAVIIVTSEVVRRVLLSGEKRGASAFAFTICALSDLAIAGGLASITDFNAFMDIAGLSLFPAISTGVLCQFVSSRHGAPAPIAYRAMMVLIPYLLPVAPNVPDALVAFVTLLLPLLLLLFLRALYEKRVKRATASPGAKRLAVISAVVGLCLGAGLIALISCQFHYGTVVIATGSMTGALNVGDAVVYEQYTGQAVSEGSIIVFRRSQSLIVHRVVEIAHINGETRYYTKGDANESRDTGFVTSADIVGITDFKISYIGYPSVWMRRLFENGS